MKKIFIGLMCATLSYLAIAESVADLVSGSWWDVDSGIRHNPDGFDDKITNVIFGDEYIVLSLEMTPRMTQGYHKTRMDFFWTRAAYLQIGNKQFPFVGHWQRSEGFYHSTDKDGYIIGRGWDDVKIGNCYEYYMVFKGHYEGEPETFDLYDDTPFGKAKSHGGSFPDVEINMIHLPSYPAMTEKYLRDNIVETGGIAGIYQSLDENPWKVACFKNASNDWVIVHLENGNHPWWNNFETKAELERTASTGTWMATVYDDQKDEVKGCIAAFDGVSLTITAPKNIDYLKNKMMFVKMFPSAQDANKSGADGQVKSGGTGFALKRGYIVTNYHVVKGMDWIDVYMDGGKMTGTIAWTDKKNDIAVLRTGFETRELPYGVSMRSMSTGDKVYALGYPLTTTMGKNVKLTDGIVNSLSGFEDDETLYQISAPVQPGNSGGPLFNTKGSITGIVSAKHLGAENVNYAIKISYLKSLLENHGMSDLLPSQGISLSSFNDKIEAIKRFVCRVECGMGARH